MLGIFNKAGKDNLRNSNNVDHLKQVITALETRVAELSRENDDFETEIARLEQAKADHQIRHAMHVSDLEHRLMVAKQQLWVASNPEKGGTIAGPDQTSASGQRLSAAIQPGPKPTASQTTSQSNASLDAERARRRELESHVADLRNQLNEERRRSTKKDKEYREHAIRINGILSGKDAAIDVKDAEIRRLQTIVDEREAAVRQQISQLERQVAEEAAQRQQEAMAYQRQTDALRREMEDLRLQKNEQSSRLTTSERDVQRLKEELISRAEQLEYYQQRLVRTAEFRIVKTPFETAA